MTLAITIPIGAAILALLVAFLIHLIGKYWMEDGTFAENFWSKRTLRYVIFTGLTMVGSLLAMYYGGPELQTILALGGLSFTGASLVAMGQKIAGDRSPSAKRAKLQDQQRKDMQ